MTKEFKWHEIDKQVLKGIGGPPKYLFQSLIGRRG